MWRTLLFVSLLSLLLGCQTDISVGKIDRADVYVQEGGHIVVDILWVIDNSGTMSEEQETLVASLDSFVGELLESDIDFHLAVVTTDADDPETAGMFSGTAPVLDRSTPDLLNDFKANATVGISGSPTEQGFASVMAALSEPQLSEANEGFLRSEAELAIVVISDEDDQSESSVSDFEGFLDDLKADTSYFLSAVVGDAPFGCASPNGAADPANRYLEVVEDTGGVSYSMCASSYAPVMASIVQLLSHIRDTFYLSRIPDPSTIQVEVDGVIIRERRNDGWSYLPESNAVRISGTPLPEAGQEIRITYDNYRF